MVSYIYKENLQGVDMAYFTKEAYEGKSNYAARKNRDNREILREQGLNEDIIELLVNISSLRHELHCSSYGERGNDLIGKLGGKQYSCGTELICQLNEQKLIEEKMPLIDETDVDFNFDSVEDILDYYEVPPTDNEDENSDLAYKLISEDFEENVNNWNLKCRQWFGKFNEKYGTDFPSAE